MADINKATKATGLLGNTSIYGGNKPTDVNAAVKATGKMGNSSISTDTSLKSDSSLRSNGLVAGHGLESSEEAAVRNAKERDESKARKADLVSNKKEIEQAKKEKQKASTGEEKKRASAIIAALKAHRQDILNRTGKQEEVVKQPVGPMQMGFPEPAPNNDPFPVTPDVAPEGGVTHPFRLSASIPAGETDYTVKVKYGTVNTKEPTGMAGGIDKKIPAVTRATGVIYLKAVLDTDGNVTEATIGEAAEVPADELNPATGQIIRTYLRLGTYTITDGVMSIAQVVTGSLWLTLCGRTVSWARI